MKRVVKIFIWIIVFIILFTSITNIVKPKYLFNSDYQSPETEMWRNFYHMEKDSIDVLFVGPSRVYCGVNTMQIYQDCQGTTSFDLCSSMQDVATSYYYIEEALKYQQPDYIVLDAYALCYDAFSNEECYKRSLDDMRWGSVKYQAIRDWQEHTDADESLLNRLFPIIDFHDRWKDLHAEDIMEQKYELNFAGYCPSTDIEEQSTEGIADILGDVNITKSTEDYFKKIITLCQNNDIKLIMISVPDISWGENTQVQMAEYLSDYDMPYWDYNTEKKMGESGISEKTDYRNFNHLNMYGSIKFSQILARDLKDYGLAPNEHSNKTESEWKSLYNKWIEFYRTNR